MAIALDGSGHSNNSGSTLSSATVSLTTVSPYDIIGVVVTMNGTGTFTVSSVSSTHTTGWANRARALNGGDAAQPLELWFGTSTAALSSETITVNFSAATGTFVTLDAFGISGANTVTKFDSNGALPATTNTNGTTVSITTSNAKDFLLGCYRFASTASPTQGSGWTKISGANFQLVEYQVVTATQSGLVATIGTGNADEACGIADALIQSTVTFRKTLSTIGSKVGVRQLQGGL